MKTILIVCAVLLCCSSALGDKRKRYDPSAESERMWQWQYREAVEAMERPKREEEMRQREHFRQELLEAIENYNEENSSFGRSWRDEEIVDQLKRRNELLEEQLELEEERQRMELLMDD